MHLALSTSVLLLATAVAVSSAPVKEQQRRGTNDFGIFAATYTQCFGGGLTPGPGCTSWTDYTVAPLDFNGCGSDGRAGYDGNEKAPQHLPSGFNGIQGEITLVKYNDVEPKLGATQGAVYVNGQPKGTCTYENGGDKHCSGEMVDYFMKVKCEVTP